MSQKVKDNKNRWRNKTVAFRMSPEEAAQLDMLAYISGLQKQEYLIKRVLQQEIVVVPNPRVQKALKTHLEMVLSELSRINSFDPNSDVLENITYLSSLISRMGVEA